VIVDIAEKIDGITEDSQQSVNLQGGASLILTKPWVSTAKDATV
jgi:hypothetical protein